MTQVAVAEPCETIQESRSASLVVLVAPTVEERNALLSQLDPAASVLVVPSVAVAQNLMAARRPESTEPTRTPESELASAVPGVRIQEDRRAVHFGSVEVTLTRLEFSLLRRLIREPGRVWRFDEIVREVWGTDHLGDASQVHAVVKRLRAKLASAHAPVVIEAVRGVGFRAVRPAARTA